MKALIVEDEFTSRLILDKFLSRYGEVMQCADGRAGVDTFAAALAGGKPFDLVCLDVMMPEMDGAAALALIRSIEEESGIPLEKRVKVIVTTGMSDSETGLEAMRAISDAVLSKPVRLHNLTWALTSLGLI